METITGISGPYIRVCITRGRETTHEEKTLVTVTKVRHTEMQVESCRSVPCAAGTFKGHLGPGIHLDLEVQHLQTGGWRLHLGTSTPHPARVLLAPSCAPRMCTTMSAEHHTPRRHSSENHSHSRERKRAELSRGERGRVKGGKEQRKHIWNEDACLPTCVYSSGKEKGTAFTSLMWREPLSMPPTSSTFSWCVFYLI